MARFVPMRGSNKIEAQITLWESEKEQQVFSYPFSFLSVQQEFSRVWMPKGICKRGRFSRRFEEIIFFFLILPRFVISVFRVKIEQLVDLFTNVFHSIFQRIDSRPEFYFPRRTRERERDFNPLIYAYREK